MVVVLAIESSSLDYIKVAGSKDLVILRGLEGVPGIGGVVVSTARQLDKEPC